EKTGCRSEHLQPRTGFPRAQKSLGDQSMGGLPDVLSAKAARVQPPVSDSLQRVFRLRLCLQVLQNLNRCASRLAGQMHRTRFLVAAFYARWRPTWKCRIFMRAVRGLRQECRGVSPFSRPRAASLLTHPE